MDKLKQAKEMLDMGLINQEMYNQIQQKVLESMGMGIQTPSVSPPSSPQGNSLGESHSTMVSGDNPLGDNPLSGNPLGETNSTNGSPSADDPPSNPQREAFRAYGSVFGMGITFISYVCLWFYWLDVFSWERSFFSKLQSTLLLSVPVTLSCGIVLLAGIRTSKIVSILGCILLFMEFSLNIAFKIFAQSFYDYFETLFPFLFCLRALTILTLGCVIWSIWRYRLFGAKILSVAGFSLFVLLHLIRIFIDLSFELIRFDWIYGWDWDLNFIYSPYFYRPLNTLYYMILIVCLVAVYIDAKNNQNG